MSGYRHFTLIIAGDNPEELLKEYDSKKEIERYCVYRFSDAQKLYDKKILFLRKLVETYPDNFIFKSELEYYEGIDHIDFFLELTEGLDIDEETGDAYSTENPNGKYYGAVLGGNFALPLIKKDGTETYQCNKGDVNWDEIHLKNGSIYEAAWDMVMGDKKPETEEEKIVYENMKNRTSYFEFYQNKENYVLSNTSFFGYAFLSQETGWVELDDAVNQIDWVRNFYDRFIVPLSDDTTISVYECTRIEDGEKN